MTDLEAERPESLEQKMLRKVKELPLEDRPLTEEHITDLFVDYEETWGIPLTRVIANWFSAYEKKHLADLEAKQNWMSKLQQLVVKQETKRTMKFIERLYPIPRDATELEEYNRFCKMLERYLKGRMNTVWDSKV